LITEYILLSNHDNEKIDFKNHYESINILTILMSSCRKLIITFEEITSGNFEPRYRMYGNMIKRNMLSYLIQEQYQLKVVIVASGNNFAIEDVLGDLRHIQYLEIKGNEKKNQIDMHGIEALYKLKCLSFIDCQNSSIDSLIGLDHCMQLTSLSLGGIYIRCPNYKLL
jgi:hypothetical protein